MSARSKMLSIFSASALAASSRVKCGSCISALSFSHVPCRHAVKRALSVFGTSGCRSEALELDVFQHTGSAVEKLILCSRLKSREMCMRPQIVCWQGCGTPHILKSQIVYSTDNHRTCVTIWLISIALSAGFSQPLLLMTSTMACVQKPLCHKQT